MGQKVLTFIFAWIFSSLLIDESETSTIRKSQETLLSRSKRSLQSFINAIQCYNEEAHVTGLADYGCFCGRGGEGIPLDETDRCCEIHDKCWGNTGHGSIDNLLAKYSSECKNGNFICQSEDKYLKALCDCDREAAICFAKNSHTFKLQFYNIDTDYYCYDNETRKQLDYTVSDEIKNKRIFINSEGVLIKKSNESEAEYPKTTEIPTLINNSTTIQDSIRNRINKTDEWSKEVLTTTASQITTKKVKATSGVLVTKTISSNTEESTKITNIDTDLDIENNKRKDTFITSTTTEVSNTDEKKSLDLDKRKKPRLDIDTNNAKYDLFYATYSGEFTFLMTMLLFVCLCCCYFFVWRYSKLPLLPLRLKKSDFSFETEVFI